MINPRLSSLLWLAILLARCVFALDPSLDITQYGHKAWKIRDGFLAGYAESITQSQDGYLWLGTDAGLVRFDGVHRVLWAPPSDTPLPSSVIRAVLAGRDGSLWIGTTNGLVQWNGKKLTQYHELDGFDVFSLLEDREGTLWAGADAFPTGRICEIRSPTVRCDGQNGVVDTGPASLYEDRDGNLWAGIRTGLLRWHPGPAVLFRMSGPDSMVYAFLDGKAGGLLLGTANGVAEFADGVLNPQSPKDTSVRRSIRRLLRDRDGGVWIGTIHGLFHLHEGRTDSYDRSTGLSGDVVTSLYEDHEGDVWVATLDGLDEFRDVSIPTVSRAQGLVGVPSSVLATSDGHLWVGTIDNGLNRWQDGEVTNFRVRDGPSSRDTRPRERDAVAEGRIREILDDGLEDNAIGPLLADDRGRVWVANKSRLSYFQDGRFIPVTDFQIYNYALASDQAGGLWISNSKSLIHWLPTHAVERIQWEQFGSRSFAVSLLTEASDGSLWLGFVKGGVAHFQRNQVIATYDVRDGLGAGQVFSLYLDRQGALWAATEGGLSRLSNGRVRTLTTTEGLPCSVVHWAMQDDLQSFWLGTACGVVRIDEAVLDDWAAGRLHTVRLNVFNSADGVRSMATPGGTTPIVTKTPAGTIWFRELDGIGVIDPRHLKVNEVPPPVQVEQVVADRKHYGPISPLRLPAQLRDLAIDYTALSLVAPENIHFRYKLEGRDRDWQSTERRQAFYTDLSPGDYRFRVIASNNSGVWNTRGAALDFSIEPAYWQTTWFRALCVLIFVALAGLAYQLRLRQLTRAFNMTLEARVSERTRIARELHDTLLQSLQGLLLRFRTVQTLIPTRPTEAQELLESAIGEARAAVTESRSAVQGLRSSALETGDFTEAIRTLGESLASDPAYSSSVALTLNIQGTPRPLQPLVRDEIYRTASEALRNAYRHADASSIEVQLDYGDRHFELRVRDDGKGIDPSLMGEAERPGHFGLSGMRERAREIGGKFAIWSAPGSGTELELTIPGSVAYGASSRARHSWLTERLFGAKPAQRS